MSAAPEGGKSGEELLLPSQPLLLINQQKSLPWFTAFDPSSSFALRGRQLGGEKGRGSRERVVSLSWVRGAEEVRGDIRERTANVKACNNLIW